MFLTPAIVIKSPDLESDISRFKHGTLDEVDIAKLWKAFASVRQYTVDPFVHACRLENFWWRVWGSKQKHLSGLELGRLCSHLYDERFNFSRRGQSDLIEESSLQITSKSYAENNDNEKAPHRFATELHSEIPSEYNPQPVLKKPIIPSSLGSGSDALFISPDKIEKGNSTAHSVPCIVLQPASINSSETKTERKRIFGPAISKKRNKVLNKKKQPLLVRRFGSHLSTDSARIADRRIRRQIIKPQSKSDEVFVTDEKSNNKALAKTRNTLAFPKQKSSDHIHYKIDSKKLEPMSCIKDSRERVFGDKMIKAGVSSVVCGLQEVSKLGTDELAVQEKINCALLTNYLKSSKSTLNNQILTSFKSSHIDSEHQSAISDTTDLNENLTLSHNKSRNIDSYMQSQLDGDIISPKTTKSDEIYNTSLELSAVTYSKAKLELSNEIEPQTIGSQMPLDIFAKRPIQPNFSLSESTDKLSTSKSELTLLIEKDRARIGEGGSLTHK